MTTVIPLIDLQQKLKIVRAERYACQSAARKALPSERVSKCLRMTHTKSEVEVWKHLKTEKAFYAGLMVCGSVWNCPICASKISERRRIELKTAYDKHLSEGGQVALLTLTFSHKKTDRLKDTLYLFNQATQKFFRGKRFDRIREKIGLIGRIRVFEITYGINGFHPHTHTALFYKKDMDLKLLEKEMYDLWEKACQKVGLTTKEKYGLNIENGEQANEYLSKHGTWSLDQEMTKSHIKKAKNESMTPFDFLRQYLNTDNERYLGLFKEYAEAMKGKRQLQWSPGLKKQFVIDDKTDEQIATEKIEQADLLGYLTADQWKQILKQDTRAKFLDMVEQYGLYEATIQLTKKETPNQN